MDSDVCGSGHLGASDGGDGGGLVDLGTLGDSLTLFTGSSVQVEVGSSLAVELSAHTVYIVSSD